MKVFYGPGDWIAEHTSARMRRAIAFWVGILVLAVTVLTWPYKNSVGVLWALSVGALLLACWAMTAAETPVETED